MSTFYLQNFLFLSNLMHLHGLRHSSKVSCLPQICLDGQGWKCRKCHPQPQYPRPLYHVFVAWDYPKCYWSVSPVQKGIWSRGHFLRRGRLSFSRLSVETDLSFSSHVKAVTKSAYYHLKNIARIRSFVSSQDFEKLVHAFITSRVDYCNGLLTGLPKKTIRQLQLIQNAAARKSEHITPVLRSLHLLPVTSRIDFKVLLLVYKSLNGLGPKYVADMLTEYKPNRPLRSVGSSQLEIPRVHTKQEESAFSYFAAHSWNQLPEEIRCAKTLATCKSRLKTHMFGCIFVEWALCYLRTDCTMYNHFLFLTVLNSFKIYFKFLVLLLFLMSVSLPFM